MYRNVKAMVELRNAMPDAINPLPRKMTHRNNRTWPRPSKNVQLVGNRIKGMIQGGYRLEKSLFGEGDDAGNIYRILYPCFMQIFFFFFF